VAQLYVGDPASIGEPPHQLKGFQRITLNAGQAQTVTFTVAAHDLAYWNDPATQWTTPAGTYQILIGDSSRNLPISGSLTVSSTISNAAVVAGSSTLTVANPHGMSSKVGTQVNWTFAPAQSGITYTATGLPAGIGISPAGVITGAANGTGTTTVTVTAHDTAGDTGNATFVWTTS
jgi:beta-glucosidase